MNNSRTSRSCGPCRFFTTVMLRRVGPRVPQFAAEARCSPRKLTSTSMPTLAEQTVLRDDENGEHAGAGEIFEKRLYVANRLLTMWQRIQISVKLSITTTFTFSLFTPAGRSGELSRRDLVGLKSRMISWHLMELTQSHSHPPSAGRMSRCALEKEKPDTFAPLRAAVA